MSGINTARVIIGGIVAGFVINVGEYALNMFVVKAQMEEAIARLNLPPVSGSAIGVFVTMGFALGIAAIWLYAAIRPRYGAGPGTALCAGAAVWFFAYLFPGIGYSAMGMFPTSLTVTGLAWGLGELLIGTLAGAALYQEQGSTAAARV